MSSNLGLVGFLGNWSTIMNTITCFANKSTSAYLRPWIVKVDLVLYIMQAAGVKGDPGEDGPPGPRGRKVS